MSGGRLRDGAPQEVKYLAIELGALKQHYPAGRSDVPLTRTIKTFTSLREWILVRDNRWGIYIPGEGEDEKIIIEMLRDLHWLKPEQKTVHELWFEKWWVSKSKIFEEREIPVLKIAELVRAAVS
jgi:hypothetical protein